MKNGKKKQEKIFKDDVHAISPSELVDVRKQEMEDFMLPNQMTVLTFGAKSVQVKSREV